MRALIAGASGLLGAAAFGAWSRRPGWIVSGTRHRQPVDGLVRLDLADQSAWDALLRRARPEAVFVAAADPDVNRCEASPAETRALNVEATLAAARAAARAGARVAFVSTDYVFDGEGGPYAEEDPPNPGCEYARQKLEVEGALAGLRPEPLVLRMSGLFGWERAGKNYVMRVLRELAAGRPVRAASDQEYNPTYAEDAADAVAGLLEKGASGVYHLAGAETWTRHAFTVEIARVFGLDAALAVPIPLGELNASSPVRRPRRTALRCARAEAALGRSLWGARRGLEHMRSVGAAWKAQAA